MQKLIILLPLFIFQALFSQIEFDKIEHNFGDLTLNSPRFTDIQLTNKGDKAHYILSIKQPSEIVYIQQRALILPGESIAIRLQANPKNKGNFNYAVEIFTSDKQKPTIIKLKGNLKVVPPKRDNSFTACPSFGDRPSNPNPLNFELTVVTRDAISKVPLGKSTVTLLQNGVEIDRFKTNKDGEETRTTQLGYTYFYATHDGYLPGETGSYVNHQRNYVIIDLIKEVELAETELTVTKEIEKKEVEKTTPIIILETKEKEEDSKVDLNLEETEQTTTAKTPFENLPEDNFSSEYFLLTNIVFVIDVSSSMRGEDKLELMKYSLYQLTDMLRPQDKIGLVSYASNANVLLKPTSGEDKDEIKTIVKDMKASGLTAGGAGIKLGYKQAKKNFLTEGKNQVIIITDGGFNRNSGDYKKYIRKYKRKGISLSVVGIKNKTNAEEQMQEAAKIGDGRYVPIFGLEDAKRNLKQEIRRAAYKY